MYRTQWTAVNFAYWYCSFWVYISAKFTETIAMQYQLSIILLLLFTYGGQIERFYMTFCGKHM